VLAVVGFTVAGGLIREIDIVGDRAKLRRLEADQVRFPEPVTSEGPG
jgi:hypothetical protein